MLIRDDGTHLTSKQYPKRTVVIFSDRSVWVISIVLKLSLFVVDYMCYRMSFVSVIYKSMSGSVYSLTYAENLRLRGNKSIEINLFCNH